MDYQFDRPIAGESLTKEPGNAPYERPPEIADPEDALIVHLQNLNNPEAMEDLVNFVEIGMDVQTLVEGILRSAVMEGIHTIDVSLLIAPTIHEFITTTLDAVGIPYDSGLDEPPESKAKRDLMNAKQVASRQVQDEDEMMSERMMSLEQLLSKDIQAQPEQQQQQQEEQPPAKPAGLMSRR